MGFVDGNEDGILEGSMEGCNEGFLVILDGNIERCKDGDEVTPADGEAVGIFTLCSDVQWPNNNIC